MQINLNEKVHIVNFLNTTHENSLYLFLSHVMHIECVRLITYIHTDILTSSDLSIYICIFSYGFILAN